MLLQQRAGLRALRTWLPGLVLAGFALSPGNARADYVYDFAGNGATATVNGQTFSTNGNVNGNSVTSNPTGDAATGSQYTVTVSNPGNNQVTFTFRDTGPVASSITDIYFADGTLLGIANWTTTGQVAYQQDQHGQSLPGAPPTFVVSRQFTMIPESQGGVPNNGVKNNGVDSLAITFDLLTGSTFQNVISELSNTAGPDGTPQLQIGIHVQAFPDGGSESFVNNPTPAALPEPSTMALVLSGGATLGLAGLRRLRRRRAADRA